MWPQGKKGMTTEDIQIIYTRWNTTVKFIGNFVRFYLNDFRPSAFDK